MSPDIFERLKADIEHTYEDYGYERKYLLGLLSICKEQHEALERCSCHQYISDGVFCRSNQTEKCKRCQTLASTASKIQNLLGGGK